MTTRQNIFILKLSDFDHTESNDFIELKIIVIEKNEKYNISYLWNLDYSKNKSKELVLFLLGFDFLNNEETYGVIVHKNKMSEVMIDYLLMDNDELRKYSGLTCVNIYRQNIMKNLANLWD